MLVVEASYQEHVDLPGSLGGKTSRTGTDPGRQAMAPIGLLADVLGDRPAVLSGQVDQQLELPWSGQTAGLSAAPPAGRPGGLPQLQGGDLVGGHHGVPGVAVGGDGDPEWAAALDRLALGDDAGVGDAGGVATGLLGEPHGAVG